MQSEDIIELLTRRIPLDRLVLDSPRLASFESDGLTAFAVRPIAVVMPESHQEVVDCITACYETATPFVARGSGTSLSGGSLPHSQGIVIALNRMNRILEIDPYDGLLLLSRRSQHGSIESFGTIWFALRTGSVESASLHDWRELGIQRGWCSLSEVWNDE